MTQQKIPVWYKQTEVGVIPTDWEVRKLWSIGVFSKWQWIRKDDVLISGYPCIRYGELYTRYSYYIKNYFSFISHEVSKTSRKLRKWDILFAGSWETKEEIWKCSSFLKDDEVYAWWDIVILSPNKWDSKFLWYLLNSPSVIKQKASRWQWDAVVHISATSLSDIIISFPDTEEQSRIATNLSDTDELISQLDELITKKKQIKQWATQKLLTPKKDREVKKLGEIADIYTGNRNNQDKIENWKYPFYVRSQTIERINSYSFDGEAILVPGEGNIGNIFHYINGKFDFHQRVYKISSFKEAYSGKYIYRYMHENFWKYAMQNSVKATVDSLRLPTFQEFEIPFPKSKDEQIQIATVLSDMDDEIQDLEQKKAKYEQIKQWAMQQLLTGKIRLK